MQLSCTLVTDDNKTHIPGDISDKISGELNETSTRISTCREQNLLAFVVIVIHHIAGGLVSVV